MRCIEQCKWFVMLQNTSYAVSNDKMSNCGTASSTVGIAALPFTGEGLDVKKLRLHPASPVVKMQWQAEVTAELEDGDPAGATL
jgi:hypothetical protein